MVYLLSNDLAFPPPELANEDGVVAVGGDVSPERLLLGYRMGIFPWPVEGFPLLWFSPDPRFVLASSEVHVGRSLRKQIKRAPYVITMDRAFGDVMDACARAPRPGQSGTWITPELRAGYVRLHELGYGHSVEAWDDGTLVGGLYGVSMGAAFFGESMFALQPDASKIAFVTLAAQLDAWGIDLIDCQVHTDHLARFGAREQSRRDFLADLADHVEQPTRKGPWELALKPSEVLARLSRDGSIG